MNHDYLDENEEFSKLEKPKLKKRKTIFKIFSYLTIFSLTSIIVFSSQVLASKDSSTSWFSKLPIIKQIKNLAESADRKLMGEKDDRINILLLGMGGKNHDGGYLTDTIILASLEPSTKKISMTSIPRDMAIPIENIGWKKINHVNAYAEAENKGSGGIAICQAVSDLLKIPVNYYVRVDFQGLVNIVDELGGIDVNVENTLNDKSYPVMGREDAEDYASRYEHLYIEKGLQHMDGNLALKFARSRHGYGIEGSDFARAKRQQKIIIAFKDKALQKGNIFKPTMISNIISEFKDHIDTNFKIWEMIKLWSTFKDTDKSKITSKVLDNGPSGLLVNKITEQGAYILSPRSGDFSEIQYFVNNVFREAPKEQKKEIVKERASLEIRNGTWINGLASRVSLDLQKYNFTIVRVGNSNKKNFQKSVIYDLTYGEKTKSLSLLKEKTNANVSFNLPEWLTEEIKKDIENEKNPVQPDFILILGQDADKTKSGTINQEEE